MSDPFLRGHKHASKLYSLAGRTPLSIRDQVFRAQTLIERLLFTKTLLAGQTLLVVGAGAAGASIAVIAARSGVKVTAVDTNPHAFALQRACTSRWVDPVQYDWPLAQATRGTWPAVHPTHAVPFGFTADYASRIARLWATRLNIERRNPSLAVEFLTRLKRLPRPSTTSPGKLDATTEQLGQRAQVRQFDVVVLAVGMASERTDVPFNAPSTKGQPHFRGIPFWMKDDFELPTLGLPSAPTRPILVTGGGDGALQDYIRLMTGNRSALELLQKVFAAASWIAGRQRHELLALQDAEQEVERASQWNEAPLQDHTRLSALHQLHLATINHWVSLPTWSSMEGVLDAATAGRPFGQIFLLHSCDHFPNCYPLNRFVALLIDTFVFRKVGHSGLVPQSRLRAAHPLAGSPHACSLGCWGHPHEAELEVAPTCFGPSSAVSPHLIVDGLVVRHGINKHSKAQWIRHILPRDIV
jgi:hypothetical protein